MPLRFRRQIKIAEGVKLNLSKTGASLTLGGKNLSLNIGRGGPLLTVDLPGGFSYRKRLAESGEKKRQAQEAAAPPVPSGPPPALTAPAAPPRIRPEYTGDVVPLAATVSPQEAAFYAGCTSFVQGDFAAACQTFTPLIDSPHRDDARFMAGVCAAYLDAHSEAISFLVDLMEQGQEPLPGTEGSLVTKYLPTATIHIPITQSSAATLPLNMLAALFLLSELLQSQGHLDDSMQIMEEVFQRDPSLSLAQLALSDLYLQAGRYEDLFDLFSHHTPELKATDNVSLEILYNWAVALTAKGLYDAADQVYKRALSRHKDIDPFLWRMVRYGRADLYERQGKWAMARKTFEQVFAEDPGFLDVSERIAALRT